MKIEGKAVNVRTDEVRYKGWNVVKKIGTGSFGSVYEIEREDFGYLYKAALKVISIPKSEQDLEAIKNNIGKSEKSLEVYYESVASDIVKEFELMYKLRGMTNIVSYEDHEVRKHEDGIGWDIFIRMELLTPLDNYIQEHQMTRPDVISLGIDICKALERCKAADIIHRDIKPGNIFVSEQGDFKLGDFGIARTLEEHSETLELSQKGTINYMAPEIFKGEKYDFNVDLYSLGMVMYKLLNHNLLPFMPQPPTKPTYKDITNANQMRMSGHTIPYPSEDNTQLAEIILKAINYDPKERYQSPQAMREHLEKVSRDEWIEEFDKQSEIDSEKQVKRKPSIIKFLKCSVIILCVLIFVGNIAFKIKRNKKENMLQKTDVISENYMNIYGELVDGVYKKYGPDMQYFLYDFDGNGIKELLIQVGNTQEDYMYNVYTVQDDQYKFISQIDGAHTAFFADETGIIQVQADEGYEILYHIELNDEEIIKEVISEKNLTEVEDYYSNSNPLPRANVTDKSLLQM